MTAASIEERYPTGLRESIDFRVSQADMAAFAALSGDDNPLHLDAAFAREKGFDGPVVYGALLVAKLSRLIGTRLPGPEGVWSGLKMDFRQPLYVDQDARIEAEVQQVSEAARSLVLKVRIEADGRLIASGSAMATLPA